MKDIKFLDPSIKRKSKITDDSFQLLKEKKFPLPSEVEISESGTCNRKCSFCPRSDPDYEKRIKKKLIQTLEKKSKLRDQP